MIIITRTIVNFDVQIYLLLLFNKTYGVGNIVLPIISDSQKCGWYFLFLLLDTSNTKNSFILLKNS